MAMELSSQELSMAKIRFFIAAFLSLEFSVNFSQKSQILRDKARFYEKICHFEPLQKATQRIARHSRSKKIHIVILSVSEISTPLVILSGVR